MGEPDLVAEEFEASRTHLTRVAYRMLGSGSEAEDAVQEAWLRLSRSGAGGIENLRREPSAEVLDAAGAGAAEPQPGFLDGVLRLAPGAQHPVGNPRQMCPAGLELLRHQVWFAHPSHSFLEL